MKSKNILFIVLATIFSALLVQIVKKYDTDKELIPVEAYRVYLEGESIGLIKSKEELEEYINVQQEKLKQKYQVDTIYIPNNINVEKEISYEKNLDNVSTIYNKINEISPFTIKGYQVIIDKTNTTEYKNDDNEIDETASKIIKINLLKKDFFQSAVENVVLSFVDKEQYNAFKSNIKIELATTGEIVENIFIEDDITIKEANLPVNETIFMDADSLTRFLVFGNEASEKKYKVTSADSLENIANKNNMSVNELLIANTDLSSDRDLLFVGQELTIGSVNPIFTTVVEKHVVEDQEVKYKTTYKYDNTMYQGQQKTIQEGRNGKNRVTQKVKMINGEISQAYIVSSEELIPVVDRIVVKGGKQAPRGDGEWLWPTNIPYIISSRFGWRWGKLHRGIDICGTGRGSPIYAARAGEVVSIDYNQYMGYHVIIKHDNGYYTQYGHMVNINGNDRSGSKCSATKYISVGQRVSAHQVIGEMGSSGNSTGVHLHFEIWNGVPYQATCFNPLLFY